MSYQRYYTYDVLPKNNNAPTSVVVSPTIAAQKPSVVEPFNNNNKPKLVPSKLPEVWGPLNWYTYHNGAANLPKNLSPVSAQRIANFINGIPEMVPCDACSEHARYFIESNKKRIQSLGTRDDVFSFFVDFHNYVNERLKKPKVSLEKAKELYNVID